MYFIKNSSRTSAVSSTNFRSIVMFASWLLVLVIYYVGEFLLGGVLFLVHYNGKCWYFYFRWGILN